jgi:micrococcal nuclease
LRWFKPNVMKKLVVMVIGFFSVVAAVAGDVLEGKVVSVIDGNTIEIVATDKQNYRFSLVGIDCPELGQEYGDRAKQFLEKLILNKSVTVAVQGKDFFGNSLAVVKIKGSKDPRVDLLKEGLAWTAEKNPDPSLDSYKAKAQEKGIGLWQSQNPTPPWIYRRQQTMIAPKSL